MARRSGRSFFSGSGVLSEAPGRRPRRSVRRRAGGSVDRLALRARVNRGVAGDLGQLCPSRVGRAGALRRARHPGCQGRLVPRSEEQRHGGERPPHHVGSASPSRVRKRWLRTRWSRQAAVVPGELRRRACGSMGRPRAPNSIEPSATVVPRQLRRRACGSMGRPRAPNSRSREAAVIPRSRERVVAEFDGARNIARPASSARCDWRRSGRPTLVNGGPECRVEPQAEPTSASCSSRQRGPRAERRSSLELPVRSSASDLGARCSGRSRHFGYHVPITSPVRPTCTT